MVDKASNVETTQQLQVKIDKSENAFFFFASGCSTSSIEDQQRLADSLLAPRLKGNWLDAYGAVTEVVLSERTTNSGVQWQRRLD